MYAELLLLLALGYVAGLIVWPWRRHMGGHPGDTMDGRFAWALMFAVLWPFILLAGLMVLARRTSR